MVRQLHFEFPTEDIARRFAYLVVVHLRDDVALCRDGCSVTVADASSLDRRQQVLSLAIRLADPSA